MVFRTAIFLCICHQFASAQMTENGLRLIRRVYDNCAAKNETFKCLKIQAVKVLDKAVHSKSFNIIEGISIVSDSRQARLLKDASPLNETKLDQLSSDEVDDLLVDSTSKFLDTHKIEVKVPRLVEEGRKRKKGGGYGGALMWALAIKGSFLAMAYNGIAVMSGTALIVGKMALLLSAILGLKKLVSGNQEKTTFEIVKHPKYSEQHTHSSSYEDEGHYQRSFDYGQQHFGVRKRVKKGSAS